MQDSIFPCHVLLHFFAQSGFVRQVERGGFMARILHRTSQYADGLQCTVPLALVWILGLCSGQAVYLVSEPSWFVPRLIVLLFMCDSYTLQECCSC